MSKRDTYQTVLVRACIIAGDEVELARRLQVPLERLIDWLLGNSKVPADIFLRAVDIVLARSKKQVRDNRAFLERMKRSHRISARGLALAFIESESGILERLARGAPLELVLTLLVLAVESLSNGVLGSVLLLSPGGRARHAAAPNLPPAYLSAIDGLRIGPAAGSDTAVDPLWRTFREHALAHGLRACWSAPIASPRGEVLGAFALYYCEPKVPGAQERQLVEVAAQLAALAVAHAASAQQDSRAGQLDVTLSPRELEIVRLIAHGEPVKRIAEDLGLKASTVYTHRARIFDKLGLSSNVLLAQYAAMRGLVR